MAVVGLAGHGIPGLEPCAQLHTTQLPGPDTESRYGTFEQFRLALQGNTVIIIGAASELQ